MRSAPDAARALRSAGQGGWARQLARQLRRACDDPRRLAEALIREELDSSTPFLGDGTAECPWIVFGAAGDFYALYVRDRELLQKVSGRPDAVVCAQSPAGRAPARSGRG